MSSPGQSGEKTPPELLSVSVYQETHMITRKEKVLETLREVLQKSRQRHEIMFLCDFHIQFIFFRTWVLFDFNVIHKS